MFLSRLFKNAKAKTMLVLAGLTMVFGVGAAVTTVAAAQQNEVVETKAANNFSSNPRFLWFLSQSGKGFTDDSNTTYWIRLWDSGGTGYVFPFVPVQKDFSTSTNYSYDGWNISTTNASTWGSGYGLYCANLSSRTATTFTGAHIIRTNWTTGVNNSNFYNKGSTFWQRTWDDIALNTREYNLIKMSGGDGNGDWMTVSVDGTISFAEKKDGSTTLGYAMKSGQMTASALGNPTPPFGKSFANWCTNAGLSTDFSTQYYDGIVYAKFSDLGTKTYYLSTACLSGFMWGAVGTLPTATVSCSSKSGFSTVTGVAVNAPYGICSFTVPNDTDRIIFTGKNANGDKTYQTGTISTVTGKDFYAVTTLTGSESTTVNGGWLATTYASTTAFPGYYITGDQYSWATDRSAFASTLPHFTRSNEETNHAELLNHSLLKDEAFKIILFYGEHDSGTMSLDWMGYTDCRDPENTTYGHDGDDNFTNTSAGSFNLYVSKEFFYKNQSTWVYAGGKLYCNSAADIVKQGYLFMPTSIASTTQIIAYDSSDASVYDHTMTIADLSGVTETTNLTFGGANVRRMSFGTFCSTSGKTVVKYSLNGGTNKFSLPTPGATADAAPLVWMDSVTSVSAANADNAKAARAAYEIANAIKNAEGSSVCKIESGDATTLLGYYDAIANPDSNALNAAATITTWKGSGLNYDNREDKGTGAVNLTAVVAELRNQAAGGAGAWTVPGMPTGTESPLTTTLWVVLGSGLAGLAAIGSAYFISKKKKRHQA